MKYMKRASIYQASNYNCTFDPTKIEARSYKWWSFVRKIEGKTVFNSYRYSVTTAKHQSKVRSLLEELGIKIDLELPVPRGLQVYTTLSEVILDAEEALCNQIGEEVLKTQALECQSQATQTRKVSGVLFRKHNGFSRL